MILTPNAAFTALSLILLLNFLTLLLSFGVFSACLQLKPGKKMMTAATLLLVLSLVPVVRNIFGSSALHLTEIDPGASWLTAYAVISLILAAAVGVTAVCLHRWRLTHISSGSIKESMDNLPVGMCYYWPGGLVKLANVRMEKLCREITGEALMNAESFRKILSEKAVGAPDGQSMIVLLPDKAAASFSVKDVRFEGHLLHEMLAVDISEEYRLTGELSELQKKADQINQRLRALSSEIKYMIMERENLEIRAAVHDQVGLALLRTKRALSGSDADQIKQILNEWQQIIRLLKHEKGTGSGRLYDSALEQAEALGITLKIDGELPDIGYMDPIIDMAVFVHLTNVMRHAEGTEAYIKVREKDGKCILHFTNNGKPPAEKIKETGGLKNLRAMVEREGGTMEIRTEPGFVMVLTMPKEKKRDGL